ncbi:glycosyltransferase family 2 protein [[Candida] arabinofermentans NRRL YB-2248]|uniref:Glycosyltransferase family 2 protein n=1 Tax=[Candida] arabinofermentans NRRL YB-2248 TaxID=983967 RepID=A0A1E4SYC5_9ASCO|nr:glycosyltransferase family 2 protein [[Candida] arabinofermentans NRRL YB-2248]
MDLRNLISKNDDDEKTSHDGSAVSVEQPLTPLPIPKLQSGPTPSRSNSQPRLSIHNLMNNDIGNDVQMSPSVTTSMSDIRKRNSITNLTNDDDISIDGNKTTTPNLTRRASNASSVELGSNLANKENSQLEGVSLNGNNTNTNTDGDDSGKPKRYSAKPTWAKDYIPTAKAGFDVGNPYSSTSETTKMAVPSITGAVPRNDFNKVITEWIWANIEGLKQDYLDIENVEEYVEVELKVGNIWDKVKDRRLVLPINTEAVVSVDFFHNECYFKSGIPLSKFNDIKTYLTKISSENYGKRSNSGGNKFVVENSHLIDLIASEKKRNDKPITGRVSVDVKTKRKMFSIQKQRIADLIIYLPNTLFDLRLSMSLELPYELNDAGFETFKKKVSLEREKERISFNHLPTFTKIDLTKVKENKPFTSELKYLTNDGTQKLYDLPSRNSPACDGIELSVVIPCYNEVNRLGPMLRDAISHLNTKYGNSTKKSYEILIVDDGSKDDTAEFAIKLATDEFKLKPGQLRVVKLVKNRGKGGAVAHGMQHARGKYMIFADADGASSFSDVEKLLTSIKKLDGDNYEDTPAVAIGSRAHMVNTDAVVKRSFIRNFLMYGLHSLVYVFGIRNIKDTQCGFKLFNKSACRLIFGKVHTERWIFDVEVLILAIRLNVPVAEVAINWHEVDGSKMALARDSINMAVDLVVIRMADALELKGEEALLVQPLIPGDIIVHTKHVHERPIVDSKIEIIYEDDVLIVINKPSGIPIHPAPSYFYNSNPKSAADFQEEIKGKLVKKEYLARVDGEFPTGVTECSEDIVILDTKRRFESGITRKTALTIFERVAYDSSLNVSVVKCMPVTGRTHQIRIHLRDLGHPIVNDPLYNDNMKGLLAKGGEMDLTQRENFSHLEKKADNRRDQLLSGEICELCSSPLFKLPDLKAECMYLHAFKYYKDDVDNGWCYETEWPSWSQL